MPYFIQDRTAQSGLKAVSLISPPIGKGGEGNVYLVSESSDMVAKVYHAYAPNRAQKLEAMVNAPPVNPPHKTLSGRSHKSIAWPEDLIYDEHGKILGFLMPKATGKTIFSFYHRGTRQNDDPNFNEKYLHNTAYNLSAALNALHTKGYVVGDINESNFFVTNETLLTLVDTDSLQVKDRNDIVYRCPVGKVEYTPPELQGVNFSEVDRTYEHDRFGLAVLIFQLLMGGWHPFSGVYIGSGNDPHQETGKRITAGYFSYSSNCKQYKSSPLSVPFGALPQDLQQMFTKCFEDAHKVPSRRPTAKDWMNALSNTEKELTSCSRNHWHYRTSKKCPWCQIENSNYSPNPSNQTNSQISGQKPMPAATAQSASIPPATALKKVSHSASLQTRIPLPTQTTSTPVVIAKKASFDQRIPVGFIVCTLIFAGLGAVGAYSSDPPSTKVIPDLPWTLAGIVAGLFVGAAISSTRDDSLSSSVSATAIAAAIAGGCIFLFSTFFYSMGQDSSFWDLVGKIILSPFMAIAGALYGGVIGVISALVCRGIMAFMPQN